MSDSTFPPQTLDPTDVGHHRAREPEVRRVAFPEVKGGHHPSRPSPEESASAILRGVAELPTPRWGSATAAEAGPLRFPRFAEPQRRGSRFNRPRFDENVSLTRSSAPPSSSADRAVERRDAPRDARSLPNPEPGSLSSPPPSMSAPSSSTDEASSPTRARDEELRAALEARAGELTQREQAIAERERELDEQAASTQAEAEELTHELSQALEAALEAGRAQSARLREARKLVVVLATQVAEVLLGEALEAEPERVEELARRALEPFAASGELEDVVVRASPATYAALTIAGATEIELAGGDVQVIPDESLSGQGVVVESPRLVIEGRVEQRLGEIRRALLEDVGQLPDEGELE